MIPRSIVLASMLAGTLFLSGCIAVGLGGGGSKSEAVERRLNRLESRVDEVERDINRVKRTTAPTDLDRLAKENEELRRKLESIEASKSPTGT